MTESFAPSDVVHILPITRFDTVAKNWAGDAPHSNALRLLSDTGDICDAISGK